MAVYGTADVGSVGQYVRWQGDSFSTDAPPLWAPLQSVAYGVQQLFYAMLRYWSHPCLLKTYNQTTTVAWASTAGASSVGLIRGTATNTEGYSLYVERALSGFMYAKIT